MNTARNLLVILMAAAVLTGCRTTVRTDAVSGNLPMVLDRHDVYAVDKLYGTDEADALSESATVRATMEANAGGHMPAAINSVVVAVLDRHDGWVRTDANIPNLDRAVFLDSAQALRLLFRPE